MSDIGKLLGKSDDIVNNPNPPRNSEEYKRLLPQSMGKNVAWGGVAQVGDTGYGDSQFDQGATYEQVTEGRLGDRRANLQPWSDQMANMLGQAVVGEIVGGTIEGLGYILDVEGMVNMAKGKEDEYTNWLSEIGGKIREGSEESMRIYEEKPGEMNMSDPGYWFKNGVSVASSLSMMLPSMAATKALGLIGKGVSKGAGYLKKSLDISKQMGVKATWMTEGVSQAIVSRHIENSMEAHGTFKDKKEEMLDTVNPETGQKFTEEEATKIASEAAAYNYRHGWAMLAQDIPQYLALGRVFNPITKKMEGALSSAVKAGKTPKWQSRSKAIGGTFLSEGAEEGYQFYIAEKGKLLSSLKAGLITEEEYDEQIGERMSSDEAKTSMLFGGLGGNLFQLAGKGANEIFKGKDRREIEKNYHDVYQGNLKNRAAQIHLLQTELNKADQANDDGEMRQHALNSLMTESIIDAVNNNKLDEFVEAITAGTKISEEEASTYKDQYGIEYSPELAKKYAPQVIEYANRIKKMHTKNLNRAENKNLPKNIVSAMTMNQFQSEEAVKEISKKEKEFEDLLNQSIFTARGPSTYMNNKTRLEVTRDATKSAIAYNNKKEKATKDKRLKKRYKDAADSHKESLTDTLKELVDLEKSDLKKTTGAEARKDKKALAALNNIKPLLVENRKQSLLFDDFVNASQDEIQYLRTPEHFKDFDKKAQINSAKKLETIQDVEKSLQNIENATDYDDAAKADITEAIENRRKEIIAENERISKEENDRIAKEEADQREAAKKADSKKIDNATNVPVVDGVEDENAGEEVDINSLQMEADEKHHEIVTKPGKTIALLDQPTGSKGSLFDKWRHNGSNKIGEKVTLEVSTINAASTQSKDAIKAFNEAIRDKKKIPQSVYDNLPIIAYIGNGRGIYTFMMTKPAEGKSPTFYNNSIGPERKRIIDALYRGEEVITEVNYTSGGLLKTEVDENGLPVENTVYDLEQIAGLDDVMLTYSDIDGKLRDVGTKEVNEFYRGRQYQVAPGEPYRGGLFLMINKADGKKFPVRMNFKKNTPEQAETLADILIEVAVPDKKGTNKNIDFDQPLKTLPEALQTKIREVMKDEVEVLGGNPTMNDLVNMFVYVSPQTEKMKSRLFFSGEWLNFGDNQSIKPGTKTSKTERDKLVDFLTNVKRRQFSLKLWNDKNHSAKYREYVLRSGVINTNVVANEPAFISDPDTKNKQGFPYRIQTYLKPITNKAPGEIKDLNVSSKEKLISSDLQKMMNLSSKTGERIDEDGNPYYSHFRMVGEGILSRSFKTMAEVEAVYQAEIDKLPNAKPQAISNNTGTPKPVAPVTTVLDNSLKIAEIESRRKEELKSIKEKKVTQNQLTNSVSDGGFYSNNYGNKGYGFYNSKKELEVVINKHYDNLLNPELAKIEEQRENDLRESNDILSNPIAYSPIEVSRAKKNKKEINAKYDTEIAALNSTKTTPKINLSGIKSPDVSGVVAPSLANDVAMPVQYGGKVGLDSSVIINKDQDSRNSFFEISQIDSTTMSMSILPSNKMGSYALRELTNQPDTYVARAFDQINQNTDYKGELLTTKPATLKMIDGKWQVVEKGEMIYTDSRGVEKFNKEKEVSSKKVVPLEKNNPEEAPRKRTVNISSGKSLSKSKAKPKPQANKNNEVDGQDPSMFKNFDLESIKKKCNK